MSKRILKMIIGVVCILIALLLGGIFMAISNSRANLKLRCPENLADIQLAKELWMQDENKTLNDTPTWNDIVPYMGGSVPVCPDGGSYTPGRVGELPKCSIDTQEHRMFSDSIEGFQKFVREHAQKPETSGSTPGQ